MEKDNLTVSLSFGMHDAQGRGSKVPFEFTGLSYKDAVHIQGRLLEIVNELHGIAKAKIEANG
ncbi:hypothetical protein SAMN05216404_106132 [Nitrosospira multiformis]|uniref:Uncharacterized protein n=1 Tax=Nitrosospira multiformis TaxID=1231 RepID=A0A1H8IQG6_9PROT|nr:hypothetical protein [Nitrosospira multiformis]SEN70236.1 hypothetical protein SAMN05216404_106132 [Nitrosospira multiformis]